MDTITDWNILTMGRFLLTVELTIRSLLSSSPATIIIRTSILLATVFGIQTITTLTATPWAILTTQQQSHTVSTVIEATIKMFFESWQQ